MKNLFPGYYPKNDDNWSRSLSSYTVVFGATVLLDLYRISQWSTFLDIVEEKVPENSRWLPYDTAWYYHQRLSETVSGEVELVKSALSHLQKFKEIIDDKCHHPFVEGELTNAFSAFVTRANDALDSNKESLISNFKSGEIKERIAQFYNGNIGNPYDESRMGQLITESNDRYLKHQNPCLSPSTNSDDRIKANRYIIWKQMQKHAKETNLPILLVLNRITPNWFEIHDDVIMPQPSLINEFREETGTDINIISAYDFIQRMEVQHPKKEELLTQLHDKPTDGNNQQINFTNNNQQVNGNG